MNILIIGLGNMGGAIAQALTCKNSSTITNFVYAVDPYVYMHKNSLPQYNSISIAPNIETASTTFNIEIETIIIAVKPQIISRVLDELQPYLSTKTLIISTVAGVPIEHIAHALTQNNTSHKYIARIMPSIAALTQESLTGLSFSYNLEEKEKEKARKIAQSIGKVMEIPETLMSSITGVSGSGIAFVASFIEALTMAGVREGLSHQQSYKTCLQTVRGALSLLSTDKPKNNNSAKFNSPKDFITAVCSPAGTTIEGIVALQKYGMSTSVFAAVHAATEKSEQFSQDLTIKLSKK